MRGLFTQTVALRLRSRDEVAMILGDGMADVAPAHRINPDEPGTGYVIAEDGSTMRVRAHYWPESLIRSVANEYGLANQRSAGPAGNSGHRNGNSRHQHHRHHDRDLSRASDSGAGSRTHPTLPEPSVSRVL